ncbi:PP2C family protein-serine/threonine phosphatase [Acidicapsa acidisoli]|uniref:PP2C family protein-serine/threonine phosphatase n=1 Tax=Acidicapsa acidisoli TaxID=1615681 RepID=UPI0021E03261|nr:PP2C family protein-serine/threonine phosphatase [Acidicapsa acidisoli]
MVVYSLWRDTSRKSVIVFLLACFCVFASFGFVGDITELGNQASLRFALGVVLSGLFAVGYAVGGFMLRSQSWKVLVPWFVLHTAVLTGISHWIPDVPARAETLADAMTRLHARMSFDGAGITWAVCIGYTGFVYVFVVEGRRYLQSQREKAVLEGEMAAAREIQEVILPGADEVFPGFRVESVYRPAQQVGGDFFQVLPASNGGLLVVVGDVAGKGLPAAMLVSMLVGSIRVVAEESYDPVLMLHKLNDRLMGRTRGGFCTALAAYIAGDGLVTIANAGHLAPYLDGEEIQMPGAFPLGIVSGAQFETTRFELAPGSRLVFYSDGVVEAMDGSGELFGFERAKAMSSAPASEVVEAAVNFGQADDITVVTVERLAAFELVS